MKTKNKTKAVAKKTKVAPAPVIEEQPRRLGRPSIYNTPMRMLSVRVPVKLIEFFKEQEQPIQPFVIKQMQRFQERKQS